MKNAFESLAVESLIPAASSRTETLASVDALSSHPKSLDAMDEGAIQKLQRQIEALPELRAYKKRHVTYDTFDTIREQVTEDLEEQESTRKNAATLRLLNKLIDRVREYTRKYYDCILRIEYMNRPTITFRQSVEQQADSFKQLDAIRRGAHNNLLEALSDFNDFCLMDLRELGIRIPSNNLFSKTELSKREIIGEWAFESELGHRVDQIREHLKERE